MQLHLSLAAMACLDDVIKLMAIDALHVDVVQCSAPVSITTYARHHEVSTQAEIVLVGMSSSI